MDKNKLVASEILKAVGGNPTVKRYRDTSDKQIY